jgi:6-phosphogluconolactonase (cycloisomerase 2 family)
MRAVNPRMSVPQSPPERVLKDVGAGGAPGGASASRRFRPGSVTAAALVLALAMALATAGVAWAAKGEPSFLERVPEFDTRLAQDVAGSPDGSSLYVASASSITAFTRDPATGEFELLEVETDGVDDQSDPGAEVDGITSTTAVALSPDGSNVYATGWQPDDSVAVFARDPQTGELSFVEAEFDGVNDPGDPGGTVDSLFRPEGLAVAPDGDSVYAVTSADDSVVAFDRDPATGELSYVETEVDGVNDGGDPGGTVDGLLSGSRLAVAPDGEGLYVSTDGDDSLVAFSRDPTTSELSFVEFEDDGVDDAGDPGPTVNGLNGAEGVAVAPSDEVVYVAGRSDNAVAVFERDTATEEVSFVEAEVNGVDDAGDIGDTVTGLSFPYGIAVSPDGLSLYAAGSSSNSLATFRYNAGTGELAFVESETDAVDDGSDAGGVVDGLASPRALTVSADGDHVYVASFLDSGLAVFERSTPSPPTLGRLSFLLARPALTLPAPRGVALTPDGNHLLLTTLGDESLRSFARDPATGALTLRDTETEGADDPSDPGPAAFGIYEPKAVTVAPGGEHVYVTDTSNYTVSLYRFDAATGELTYVDSQIDDDAGGTIDGLYEPWDVVVSSDGASVYAPGSNDDAVVAFERDAATGALEHAETELNGANDAGDPGGPVDGLVGAESLAISPGGEHVYVAGRNDDALAVFARDPQTSELSFVEAEIDGADDGGDAGPAVAGLDDPRSVAVSRDGANAYVVAADHLLRFDRDPASGRLSFAEVEEDGVDDPTDAGGVADGLISATSLALSTDGAEVYVGSDFSPGKLATFARDPASGALSFLDVEVEGADDPTDPGGQVVGLEAADLATAPDDRHIYVASEGKNGIAIFGRDDDFTAPETTITGGPEEGATTADATPPFGFASSDPGSTFACSLDGAQYEACVPTLFEFDDGPHSLSARASDPAGNTDPTPAVRGFTVDTKVSGGKVKAAKKQKQKGERIKVELELETAEDATGTGSGKIVVGKKAYKLRRLSKGLEPGKRETLKLKPEKAKHAEKIADALADGETVKAKLTGKIVDAVGNQLVVERTVKLKRR